MSRIKNNVVPLSAPPRESEREIADGASPRSVRIDLGSGRRVEVEELVTGEQLSVCSPDGRVELRVRLTDAGPVLDFEAASFSFRSPGKVAIDCERLEVKTREDIALDAGGAISERATGDHAVEATGRSTHKARSVSVESDRGNITLEANDDVVMLGERIRLN